MVRFELTTPCTQNRCASQATPHSVRYKLAGMTGLEPATSAVTGQCSNQLNYIPKSNNAKLYCKLQWCVWMDLNHRPSPYQRDALTN